MDQPSVINDDFLHAVKRLRRVLPKLSFGLLIATYLISALIMGIFHAQKAENTGMLIAAFLVPIAIQAGRGTLVFFCQLNPERLQGRISVGFLAATVLLILSLLEGWLVMRPYDLAWGISVSTLMLIGWVLEIMILKETMFATEIALYRNQEQWEELKNFYRAKAAMEAFKKSLSKGRVSPDNQELLEVKTSEAQAPGKLIAPSLNGRGH